VIAVAGVKQILMIYSREKYHHVVVCVQKVKLQLKNYYNLQIYHLNSKKYSMIVNSQTVVIMLNLIFMLIILILLNMMENSIITIKQIHILGILKKTILLLSNMTNIKIIGVKNRVFL
jgi:hypothetical protein